MINSSHPRGEALLSKYLKHFACFRYFTNSVLFEIYHKCENITFNKNRVKQQQ